MDLLILGAGGYRRVVREVAEMVGKYKRIAFLDIHMMFSTRCDRKALCL